MDGKDLDRLLQSYVEEFRTIKQNLKELNKQEDLKGGGTIDGDLWIGSTARTTTNLVIEADTDANLKLNTDAGEWWIRSEDASGTPQFSITLFGSGGAEYLIKSGQHTWYDGGATLMDLSSTGTLEVGKSSTANALRVLYDANSYVQLSTNSAHQFLLNGRANSGTANLDLNPLPVDGTSNAQLRIFRTTNTTGATQFVIYKGDNSTTKNHELRGNGHSWLAIISGQNLGIGTTIAPLGKVHIIQGDVSGNAIPTLALGQADLSEEFIDFRTTVGTGNPIDTGSLGSYYGRARVAVNGTFKWLALYN